MGGGGGQRCFNVPLSLQKNKVRQEEHVYKCTGSAAAAAAAVAELQQEKERVTMGACTRWTGPCPCQAWLISNQYTWAAAFTSSAI